MANNDRYFYISGFISLIFIFFVVFLFAYMLIASNKIRSFALKKDNYIAISLNIAPSTSKAFTQKSKNRVKPERKKEEISEKIAKLKTQDISSLFSSVKTQKVKQKPKKPKKVVDLKRLASLSKRIKTSTKNDVEKISKKVKKLKLSKSSVEVSSASASSSATHVDEYLAKIQVFVYNNFYPPASTEGSSAKIRIWLNENGKLSDFRILAKSNNSSFNEEVELLKERLNSLTFPRHPRLEKSVIDIILTAKE
ncbi:MAG: hypothetical protein GQ570_07605 [Helicobacteraceae bacterium]|nr:hypothetical protein [Helicobacteraceae bacterium]